MRSKFYCERRRDGSCREDIRASHSGRRRPAGGEREPRPAVCGVRGCQRMTERAVSTRPRRHIRAGAVTPGRVLTLFCHRARAPAGPAAIRAAAAAYSLPRRRRLVAQPENNLGALAANLGEARRGDWRWVPLH
jgi:hypothetical protein